MSNATTKTIDKLYCLTCFMAGLDGYPGARHDATLINREAGQLLKRLRETPDVVTDAEMQQVQRLWEWAAAIDLVYRQSALLHYEVGELNGHLWSPSELEGGDDAGS